MKIQASLSSAALAALLLSPAVLAQDWTLKAGAIRCDAHSKTDGVQGIGIPPGADAEVGDAGQAMHAGLGYAIDKQWGLFASVGRVDVKTKLVATASTVLTSNIDLRPTTYSAGLTYRF